ncbi:MAG: hypothetical protein ACKOCN_02235 [Planctomycetaceae bacterium]
MLGFVTADAKNSFDNASGIVVDTAIRLVSIDRVLADFGEEGENIRTRLTQVAEEWIVRIKSHDGESNSDLRCPVRCGSGPAPSNGRWPSWASDGRGGSVR